MIKSEKRTTAIFFLAAPLVFLTSFYLSNIQQITTDPVISYERLEIIDFSTKTRSFIVKKESGEKESYRSQNNTRKLLTNKDQGFRCFKTKIEGHKYFSSSEYSYRHYIMEIESEEKCKGTK